jgi:hypothetical protein
LQSILKECLKRTSGRQLGIDEWRVDLLTEKTEIGLKKTEVE